MTPRLRKIVACIGGVGIFLASIIWAFQSSDVAANVLGFRIGLPSEFAPGDAVYKKFGDVYTLLSVVGLSLAAGLSFSLLVWERRPRQLLVDLVYWLLLAVAMPMTVINYWSADIFVSRSQQVLLNLILCFLCVMCLVHLIRVGTSTVGSRVLKAFAIFFLAFQGIFVPAVYTLLWWLNWQSAISLADSQSFAPGWISAVASIGALIISILQYRLTAAKEMLQKSASDSKVIVIERSGGHR